jgi:hypothetical protein
VRVIIAGPREGVSYEQVRCSIESCPLRVAITEVVSGRARGVDLYGEQWAEENDIPIKKFPADWVKFGKRAGPIRNVEMADYAEGLIAIWNGTSRGTKHMIETARKKGLIVYVYEV